MAYTIAVAGLTSRYRSVEADADWPTHHATCATDLPGATHMIVYDSLTELQLVGTLPQSRYLVGHFEMAGAQAVDAGWLTVTGDTVLEELWLAGQPNDDGAGENGEQDRAFTTTRQGRASRTGRHRSTRMACASATASPSLLRSRRCCSSRRARPRPSFVWQPRSRCGG